MMRLLQMIVVTILVSAILLHEEVDSNISTPSVHIALVLPETTSQEIVDGALATVKLINSASSTLHGLHLELVYPRIRTTFAEIESIGMYNITALVGLFQLSDIQAHYPLAVASRLNIPLLFTGSPDPRVFDDEKYPQLFHLVQPTTDIIRDVFRLLATYDWNRVSIITDTLDHQNFDTVGQFKSFPEQYSKMEIQFYSITMQRDVKYVLKKLDAYISIVSLSPSNTLKFLCEAYLKDKVWPSFIWIVLYHSLGDILPFHDQDRTCKTEQIVEGVIFVYQQLLPPKDTMLVSGVTYEELVHDVYNSTLDSPFNAHRNILHDALWATTLAINATISSSGNWTSLSTLHNNLPRAALNGVGFSGATGYVQFSPSDRKRAGTKVAVFQVINGTKLYLEYNLTKSTHFDQVGLNSTAPPKPSIQLVVFFFTNAACFIFVTVVLVLFCYYRKRDSIKSTSFSLSIMIFIGCYLILLYVFVVDLYYLPQYGRLSVLANFKRIECLARIWLHALGVPSIFIFATLFVKMARVYYIFLSPRQLKFSSNTALFIYIMLLMIPNVVVHILWTVDTALYGDGLVSCTGTQSLFLWLYIVAGYFMILLVALVILAILTRKIRYRNFKDTKKVNALVLLLLYTYAFTLSLWMLLRLIDFYEQHISRLVLHVGHILVVVECTGLLFVPKIYPFLKETFQNRVWK